MTIPKVKRETIQRVMSDYRKKIKEIGKLEAMRQDAFYIEQPVMCDVCLELEGAHNFPPGSVAGLMSICYKSIIEEVKNNVSKA